MATKTSVIVVGAGPSGLAVSACLKKKGVDNVVLERETEVAPRWRTHYERLHLHTFRNFSTLPFKKWAAGTPRYPSRRQVVDYMEGYAEELGVTPLFGQEVKSAKRINTHWQVDTQDQTLEGESLVIATGYNRTPFSPTWPGQESFQGTVLHSRDYRNGAKWKGKRALVVGAGNTGGEIAVDFVEHGAETTLCVRSPIHFVPRDVGPIPAQLTGMLMAQLPLPVADRIGRSTSIMRFGDLSEYGIVRPEVGPFTQITTMGRVPLIDIGTIGMIRDGRIGVVPGVERFDGANVRFVNGTEMPFDVVILATGYRPTLGEFLDGAEAYLNERGYPKVHGAGANPPDPYFVGYGNPPTGQLNEINKHARAVADKIARLQS